MVTLSDTTLCPPTIVLVEDSKGDAHIIQEAVAEQIPGSRLEHIEDAPRALKFLDDLDSSSELACPAVFVVDLNLPGGWGGSVVERIRGGRCGRVPILISSSARADSVPELAKFGAHFFSKPSSYEEFFAIGKVIHSLMLQGTLCE
jgi:DNA-binding response OmpR family regulator